MRDENCSVLFVVLLCWRALQKIPMKGYFRFKSSDRLSSPLQSISLLSGVALLPSSVIAPSSGGAVERHCPDEHFTDGKMQLWCRASMFFLEDASSLNRGSTFSTICQGYLRRPKQWSSHSRADSGRGPTLGHGAQTISLILDPCLFKHTVMGSVGTDSGRTLRSHFHSCLHILLMSVKEKITGGM